MPSRFAKRRPSVAPVGTVMNASITPAATFRTSHLTPPTRRRRALPLLGSSLVSAAPAAPSSAARRHPRTAALERGRFDAVTGVYHYGMRVRDAELDQYGVVNHAVYAAYIQHARHQFGWRVCQSVSFSVSACPSVSLMHTHTLTHRNTHTHGRTQLLTHKRAQTPVPTHFHPRDVLAVDFDAAARDGFGAWALSGLDLRFFAPLRSGDDFSVESRVARVTGARCVMLQRIIVSGSSSSLSGGGGVMTGRSTAPGALRGGGAEVEPPAAAGRMVGGPAPVVVAATAEATIVRLDARYRPRRWEPDTLALLSELAAAGGGGWGE